MNFGFAALDERIGVLRAHDPERIRKLFAPAEDAPVLLPAHLDLLCQTAPRPAPEPDIALFLHGKRPSAPEVRVVFRSDLKMEEEDIEALTVLPPTSPEILTVPRHRLKKWLLESEVEDRSGDVEGEREPEETGPGDSRRAAGRSFVIWRGPERSEVTRDVGRIRPDDVVVLASKEAIFELGQGVGDPRGMGPDGLDLAEPAFRQARGKIALRINRNVMAPSTQPRADCGIGGPGRVRRGVG